MTNRLLLIAVTFSLAGVAFAATANEASAQVIVKRGSANSKHHSKGASGVRKSSKKSERRSRTNLYLRVGTGYHPIHHGHHHHTYRSHWHRPHHRLHHHHSVLHSVTPPQVIVVESDTFRPPPLECPIRTEAVTVGLEQWCQTPRGTKHGDYRRWYTDGTLAAQGAYAFDAQEGAWTEWHPNGALREEGEFVKGRRVGTWVSWTSDGAENSSVEY